MTTFATDVDGISYIDKDPNATIDYTLNWADWLGVDTISAATWTVPSGLTKETETFNATTTTVWLSSGTLNTSYLVSCRITTANGRIDDRSFRINIMER